MLTFKIPDMSCGHCVKTIETAVKSLDPKAAVSCDLDRHEVTVESTLAPARIAAAMDDVGYLQRAAGGLIQLKPPDPGPEIGAGFPPESGPELDRLLLRAQ